MTTLRTPLHSAHVAAGARMVPFAGWDMPVQYADGIVHEVGMVRNHAGMFDVSHMARFEFTGTESGRFLDTLLSQPASKLRHGQAKYHVICNQAGGIIDDAIVYNLEPTRYLLVSNAGNAAVVRDWLTGHLESAGSDTRMQDITDEIAMIALQGPEAVSIASEVSAEDSNRFRRFHAGELTIDGERVLAARTGYTGEDGFEIMCDAEHAAAIWQILADYGVTPCGLGARDVLRLEAGMLLHGSDMSTDTNPYEVGLGWTVTPDRSGFIARDSLLAIRDSDLPRKLTGFNLTGRGIARRGHTVFVGDRQIGTVTSGTFSPTLKCAIGLAMLDAQYADPGRQITVDVRGRKIDGVTVSPPSYKRS